MAREKILVEINAGVWVECPARLASEARQFATQAVFPGSTTAIWFIPAPALAECPGFFQTAIDVFADAEMLNARNALRAPKLERKG